MLRLFAANRAGGDERGQGIVEFALIVVFLLLVLFAIVDFSRLFFAYATMSNGVREGARYGIIHPEDDTGIKDRAYAMMVLIGGDALVEVEYEPDPDDPTKNCYRSHECTVVVIATSELDVWTPVLPSIPIEAKATMHIE